MNELLVKIAMDANAQTGNKFDLNYAPLDDLLQKFSELLIEAVLDEVAERSYYTNDRNWSDEMDRKWIRLEFGYGSLANAKKGIFK